MNRHPSPTYQRLRRFIAERMRLEPGGSWART
jgi:hypothetical protein